MNKKEIFIKLFPNILSHILKSHYRNRNYIFVLILEEKTNDNIKRSDIEIKLSWHGDHIRISPLTKSFRDEIENIYVGDDYFYTKNNVKLVIMAQEQPFLEYPEKQKINKNKTFKNKECVVCFTNSPNVLFCDCGHICLCAECVKIDCFEECPTCKTENTILRIIE